jgi:hypothetical protein
LPNLAEFKQDIKRLFEQLKAIASQTN